MAFQLGAGDLYWAQPNFTVAGTAGFRITVTGGASLAATDLTLATGTNMLASVVAADIQAKVRAAGSATFLCEFVGGKFRMIAPSATSITVAARSAGTDLTAMLFGGTINTLSTAGHWMCNVPTPTAYTVSSTKIAQIDSAALEITADMRTTSGDGKYAKAAVAVSGDGKFRANFIELDIDTLQTIWGWYRTGAGTSGDPYVYELTQSTTPVECRLVYKVPYDVANPALTEDTTLLRALSPTNMLSFKKDDFFGQEIEFQLLANASDQIVSSKKNLA